MNPDFQEALLKQLNILKTKYSLIGIKSEFEAEGSTYKDVARLQSLEVKTSTELENFRFFISKYFKENI